MRVYVAGPMSGYKNDNIPAFEEAGRFLESLTAVAPVLPHTLPPVAHEGECPPGPRGASVHSAPCHLRADINALVLCDAILLLGGWNHSAGARLEMQVASQCALDIYVARYGMVGVHWQIVDMVQIADREMNV